MAFLAPPRFKCPTSTRAAVFREPAGGAGPRPGRVNCSVASTAVVDAELLECLSVGPGPPPSPHRTLPGGFGEALLNKEAMVTAAAAEAVALARAAAELAGEVSRMAQRDHRTDSPQRDNSEGSFLAREVRRTEAGWESRRAGLGLLEGEEFSSIFTDESEDEGECTEGVVAVKSARRSERRARRIRAAMMAAQSFSKGKPGGTSSSSKKRLKGCRNPLGCFYKMTGPRLLTAKQEVEFSEGIQVTRHKLKPNLQYCPVACALCSEVLLNSDGEMQRVAAPLCSSGVVTKPHIVRISPRLLSHSLRKFLECLMQIYVEIIRCALLGAASARCR